MIELQISNELKVILKNITIASLQAEVEVMQSGIELESLLDNACNEFRQQNTIKDISKLNPIADSRKAFRLLGKDPSRYRLSSEALLRRIIKQKKLYKINNIVEINNLVSIKSYYSICTFDLDKINVPVIFTKGNKEDEYIGIGRGSLNIENLPAFADKLGKFGTPVSDSERVKVSENTTRILMNIISFSVENNLNYYLDLLKEYLTKFANAKEINTKIFI